MKRLLSLFTVLFVSIVSLANDFNIVEPLDTNSYVMGFQYTGWAVMDDNGLLRDENDYKEYIRGLEENLKNAVDRDSSYVMSYAAGAMQGVFMTDAPRRREDMDFFGYMIEGLRKVADDKVVLPADTIEAYAVVNRYGANKNFDDIKDSAQQKFFTAIGLVSPFQPGLQEYINSFREGTDYTFNRQAYASGMADVLANIMIRKPKSAYKLGKTSASNVNISLLYNKNFDKVSFIYGAKAALGLGEHLIDKDYMEGLTDQSEVEAAEPEGDINSSIKE